MSDSVASAIDRSFLRVEGHARKKDYAGYCKFDALNSRFIEVVFGGNWITRLLAIQAVNRLPLPLRQCFAVRKLRNPKGIANFARAYAIRYSVDQNKTWLDLTRGLSDWLLAHSSQGLGAYSGSGMAWGYHFPWQSPGFFAPRNYPNCIVTTFSAEALLEAFRVTNDERYLWGAEGAVEFILKDLPILESSQEEKCIGYVTSDLSWKVININSVVAGFLAKVGTLTGKKELCEDARKMINWVIRVRNDDNSWNYTCPKSQSGIGPDNYHTGGILDGIFDYMSSTNDYTHKAVYLDALKFYRDNFFTPEGGPKWRVKRVYPMDIHGTAQGILTFSRAAALGPEWLSLAERVAEWAIENMQDVKTGHFYYQRFRHWSWKIDLMRWNNSWMMMALAELMRARQEQKRAL